MAKQFTAEEVAKHNSATDCWVIIHGKVLNLTSFLAEHPGGKDAILAFAGKDATEDFEMMHEESYIAKYTPDAVLGTLMGAAKL